MRAAAWADPVAVAAAYADEPYAAVLLGGARGWSYLLRTPDAVRRIDGQDTADIAAVLPGLIGSGHPLPPDVPPFLGGVLGLASYELSARLEATAPQARDPAWPDLVLARYPALLAFRAEDRRVVAVGRGRDPAQAAAQADAALRWLDNVACIAPVPTPMADSADLAVPDPDHAAAVARTIERIADGEIFQANLARPWRGRLLPGRMPFELFARLARASPAPYAAYLRLPGLALVSNSPERFLSVRREADGLWAETRPIKGTRPRGADPTADAALARELTASAKDRAENLMIVDLMRNDLARVCAPGTVQVPELAALESYANVHHLVSRVRGRLSPGRTAWDAFLAAFPPGSVTGAPKLQAMSVIARHETPRGPYCGSLFWAGFDGSFEASVLIRTVALMENAATWTFEARAGGGIVADSDPDKEVAETTVKAAAILKALTGTP
jgi:para-aminobenzoate synthetase component 1